MKILPIAAFFVTAAIGWIVAGNVAKPAKSATVAAAAPTREHRPERKTRHASGPDEAARQQLAAIRASRDPAVRMRATVDLASTLSPSEFAAWMDGGWFDIRGGAELTLFTKIIQERWRNEDAEGLVLWAVKNQSGQGESILNDWAAHDPQRALAFFKDHPNDGVEIRLLSQMAKTDPATALRRFQEMAAAGISQNDQSYLYMLTQELAQRSPAALEAALDSLPGAWRTQAEVLIIAGRMKDSFGVEFAKLLDRPDGAQLFTRIMRDGDNNSDEREAVRDKLLAGLGDLPSSWRAAIASQPYGYVSPKSAERWLDADLEGAGFTDEQSKQIRTQALGYLIGKPELAVKYLASMDLDESNRRSAIANIFSNLRNDPEKAASLAAMLENDGDRKYALEHAAAANSGSESAKIETPADWLGGIATLDKDKRGGEAYRFMSAARDWDQAKLADLSRQFEALPDETKRAVAETTTQTGYSDKPLEAESIRFLVAHPAADPVADTTDPFSPDRNDPGNREIRLASSYVGKIARDDPAAAGDWIATLPAGQPKLWAQKNLHSVWSQYDPSAADQWLQSLPATDRTAIGNLKKQR